ncbi:MAG TPA: 3'-5' exonuclease [Tepidisphaeraceae bacterium]|nr:3'-5' exonuclease [Tepidisphaeraceae bacterium]
MTHIGVECPRAQHDLAPAAPERGRVAEPTALGLSAALAGHVVIRDMADNGRADVFPLRIRQLIERGVDPSEIAVLAANRRPSDLLPALADGVLDRLLVGTVDWFLLRALRRAGGGSRVAANVYRLDNDVAAGAIATLAEKIGLVDRRRGHTVARDLLEIFDILTARPRLTVGRLIRERYPRFIGHEAGVEAIRAEHKRQGEALGYITAAAVRATLAEALRSSPGLQGPIMGSVKHVIVDRAEMLTAIALDCLCLMVGSQAKLFVYAHESLRSDSFLIPRGDTTAELCARLPSVTRFNASSRSRRDPYLERLLEVLRAAASGSEPTASVSPSGVKPKGSVPLIRVSPDERSRDRRILSDVLRLAKRGVSLTDQAVLSFDANDALGLQQLLANADVPFRLVGPQGIDRLAHASDALSMLRIAANHRNAWAWAQALRLMTSLGEQAIARLVNEAGATTSLESALARVADMAALEVPRHSDHVATLCDALRHIARLERPTDQFGAILSFARTKLARRYKDRSFDRMAELAAVRRMAGAHASLEAFLDHVDANPPELRFEGRGRPGMRLPEPMLTVSSPSVARGQVWTAVHVLLPSTAYLTIPQGVDARCDDAAVSVPAILHPAAARATRQLTFHLSLPRDGRFEVPQNAVTAAMRLRGPQRA